MRSRIRPALLAALAVALTASPALSQSSSEDVELRTDDGVVLHGDYVSAGNDSRPLILLFHQGGASVRAEYRNIAPRLAELGYDMLGFDLRRGGDLFDGHNRTLAALGDQEFTFCDAYADVQAALSYATHRFSGRTLIAWGSSFSASLVVRLAADHPEALTGVLAFSPASGGPMGDCSANPYAEQVAVPLMVLRPESEAARESVAEQLQTFENAGHRTYVSRPGEHGSSMLDAGRVGVDTEATWDEVIDFLAGLAR